MAGMGPSSSCLPPKFDPHSQEAMTDPYAVYQELRNWGGLCRGGPGQWVASRYADVAALLRDPRLGHEFIDQYQTFSPDEPVATLFRNVIFERDPPLHTRLRQALAKACDAAIVARVQERIRKEADKLLAPALSSGSFDAVSDLASPLPIRAVGAALGIPADDLAEVYPHAILISNAFDMRNPPNQDRQRANEAVESLRTFLNRLVEERRRKPADDMLSVLANAGDLSPAEIVDNAIFLFFSGLETTKDVISIGCAALLAQPDQLSRLRRDPSLIATAVEEFLRYDAPIQALARLVREPIEMGGRILRSGRVLVLLIGAANRDQSQFESPERLDVGRRPNPHLTFGGGPYYCLGAGIARATAVCAFERLLGLSDSLSAASPPTRVPSAMFRSYQSVPVAIRAA
jgi:cytochrome P450